MTAGIVGLGFVGSAIVRRAAAFGMDTIGYDIRAIPSADLAAPGLRQAALDAVYADSDVVFLACELTPQSYHLVSGAEFDAMKDGVLIVNVARGGLIDQPALVEAMRTARLPGRASMYSRMSRCRATIPCAPSPTAACSALTTAPTPPKRWRALIGSRPTSSSTFLA